MDYSELKPDPADQSLPPGHFYYLSDSPGPVLEIQPALTPGGRTRPIRLPLHYVQPGRRSGEGLWVALLPDPLPGPLWEFRVRLGYRQFDAPEPDGFYRTALRTVWLQDQQLFDYRPAPAVSPSRVVKIPTFTGRLPRRALYIYTPRGYAEHLDRYYPVIYMHDGQNAFEAYAADSYIGSWMADETADARIGQGRMQECLIVGVSHGQDTRRLEYTPPYIARPAGSLVTTPAKPEGTARRLAPAVPVKLLSGRADQTFAYYRDDVAPYIQVNYRALAGREHTAVCGSSMGGIFSLYIAWEHPEFARHYAALSPAFAMTTDTRSGEGVLERLQTGPRPDVRLWLDSGTHDSPGKGDDDMAETRAARDALLGLGFTPGEDFRYALDEGAIHHESAWAARLPEVFSFLFPPAGKSN